MKLGFTTFLSIYDDLLDLMCLWNPASAFSVPFYPTYGTKLTPIVRFLTAPDIIRRLPNWSFKLHLTPPTNHGIVGWVERMLQIVDFTIMCREAAVESLISYLAPFAHFCHKMHFSLSFSDDMSLISKKRENCHAF